MSAFKKTCAGVAIVGGLVLAAGPAVADSGSGGSSLPSTGSSIVDDSTQFLCAFVTGVTGSGASVIGSSVPDIPGCS